MCLKEKSQLLLLPNKIKFLLWAETHQAGTSLHFILWTERT